MINLRNYILHITADYNGSAWIHNIIFSHKSHLLTDTITRETVIRDAMSIYC